MLFSGGARPRTCLVVGVNVCSFNDIGVHDCRCICRATSSPSCRAPHGHDQILRSMKIEIDTMLALTQSVEESWINRSYATFKSCDCCAFTIFHIHMQRDLRAQVTLNMCGYMLFRRLGSPSPAHPLLFTSPTTLWPNIHRVPHQATKRGAGVIPSPSAPYSKEPHKRHGFPPATSRSASPWFCFCLIYRGGRV